MIRGGGDHSVAVRNVLDQNGIDIANFIFEDDASINRGIDTLNIFNNDRGCVNYSTLKFEKPGLKAFNYDFIGTIS